ncbi:MAG: NUDIX hydrolase, partial [Porticoccaceae bacterium]
MNFCSACGSAVVKKIPEGDNRERHVCDSCEIIHYQNPKVIAGVLPVYGEQVLLCKRSIEPRHGFWTLPAGFLENGESSLDGALRECVEEANAVVINPSLYA